MVTQAILLRFPRVLKGQCPIFAELIRVFLKKTYFRCRPPKTDFGF